MKKTILVLVAVIALVVVLGSAAFVAGKLMMQRQASKSAPVAPPKLVTPAAGVPTADPDARGDTLGRDGNSIFVCESNPVLTINLDGTINKNGSCTLQVEVVTGHDTVVLHDVSALRNPSPAKQGESYIIQQIIEPGSSDDISVGTAVRAWGAQSGNRVMARTLLYWNRLPQPTPASGR